MNSIHFPHNTMSTTIPPGMPYPFIPRFSIAGSSGPPSETPSSEFSSIESDFSDLKSIAAGLGITDPEEVYMERFKIDRIKLEDMIKTESYCEGLNRAEYFFTTLMKESLVHVSWPCRLKIGAKTRKDPHVRIVGRKEDVLRAKDKVMAVLDAKGNRVIMKMDVSYTDHSYIIGRGGNNIKRIMDETQTHIHFPDSNRSNPTEKSNQVSLCGSLEGVEKARSMVRASTPLLISYELPIMIPGSTSYDNNTPFVKEMEKQYGVQVIFSTRPKLHSSMILVKGCEKEHKNVMDATKRLIEFMFEDIAQQIPVQMHLEISTQHHPVVLGKGSQNLREIMQRTSTKIIFPDANDMNVRPIKRSQVTISGPITGVYLARQQLLGNIPIALIFDYPEINIDTDSINKLMASHDVYINSRQKSRQSTMCIVIKGVEKYITNIYDARHQLLKLTSERIVAAIPTSYYGPHDMEHFKCNSIAQLLAGPTTYGSISPLQPIPPITWSNNPDINNWRSRPQVSPLTSTVLQQHNKMTGNLQVPSNMTIRSTMSDLHSSGYHSFSGDSSMMKTINGGSSNHSSPDSAMRYGKYNQNIANLIENQHKHLDHARLSAFNESMMYNYDPRIIAGQGAGISRTSPTPIENPQSGNVWVDSAPHENNIGGIFNNVTTSLLETTPVRTRDQISKYQDIETLLTGIRMQHHVQSFIDGEIDMTVFPTLNEVDLLNLGIKPLGARRRIMMAVQEVASRINLQHELQQQIQQASPPTPLRFNGSVAPGDERRSSTNSH
ncbi:CLUMA_CG014408, isoform A [Clunio marinus]|uniref:CLUMA_CG014408, isoform A n=1 Tax=Clunio marinus TaxID=568069 RepID=A0A1J1IL71_9DIPT|nr:CLUMA_CG014408, isoform A [Clunio marinus]